MTSLRLSPLSLLLLLVGVSLSIGCSVTQPTIEIPHLPTAKEQYFYAKRVHISEIPRADLLKFAKPERQEEKLETIIYAYEKVVEYYPEDITVTPRAMVDIANCYEILKDYNTAINLYKKVLERYPENDFAYAAALYGVANCYHKKHNYKKAIIYYEQCIDEFKNTASDEIKPIVKTCELNRQRLK